MCHPDPPPVIVVSDSDRDDFGGSQSDTSIVSLVNSLTTAKASGSTRFATSRRGKSRLMSCGSGLAQSPTTDTGIRRRPTRSQLHEVIVIDCDESSDTPLVRS